MIRALALCALLTGTACATSPGPAGSDPIAPPDDEPPPATRSTTPPAPPRGAGTASITRSRLEDASLNEASGLAVSMAGDGLLWAVNDSGNGARLYVLDEAGGALGRFEVDGENRDWEALDSGFIDGIAVLLIGDTGDNLRHHDYASLLLVAEPDTATSAHDDPAPVLPARRIDFRFDNGAHDVEALALDGDIVWMLDKAPMTAGGERVASGLYRLDLGAALSDSTGAPAIANRVSTFLAPIDGLKARLAAAFAGIDLGYPTGLDLDADRAHAWVLTYRDVLRYDRRGDEPWSATLSRTPAWVHAHGLAQAEAMTVRADGTLLIASEGVHAQLLRIGSP